MTKFFLLLMTLGYMTPQAMASSGPITYGEVMFECTAAGTPDLSVDQTMFDSRFSVGVEGTVIGQGVVRYTNTDVYLDGQHIGRLAQTPTCTAQAAAGVIDSTVEQIILDSGIQLTITESPGTAGCFLNDLHNGFDGANTYTRINSYSLTFTGNAQVYTGSWENTAYYGTMQTCQNPNS